jgi:Rrf2 family iron-sulfur cluster assembly transcriptional regulator
MILSKSFGYALRSIIYMALISSTKHNIQLQEISDELSVPRHFLGKVMKRLAKNGVVDSAKGRTGGFMLNERTLSYSLKDLIILIEGDALFSACVIGFKKCNEKNPCPLHRQIVEIRKQISKTYSETKIGDLLINDKTELLKSLIAA